MGLLKTKVVHCKKSDYDIYIGRPSIYGNPWTHCQSTKAEFIVSSREEAIINYRKWLKGESFKDVLQERRGLILKSLPELKGRVLGCWCKPKKCHGDVLLELIDGESKTEEVRISNLF